MSNSEWEEAIALGLVMLTFAGLIVLVISLSCIVVPFSVEVGHHLASMVRLRW